MGFHDSVSFPAIAVDTAPDRKTDPSRASNTTIMFSVALSGMVGNVALEGGEGITGRERAELILQIEDENVPAAVHRRGRSLVRHRSP